MIAQGAPVVHTRELRELWESIEEAGEKIEAEKNDRLLDEMSLYSLYGTKRGYGTPGGENPKTLAATFGLIVEQLAAQAESRVPALVAERGLRGTEPKAGDRHR